MPHSLDVLNSKWRQNDTWPNSKLGYSTKTKYLLKSKLIKMRSFNVVIKTISVLIMLSMGTMLKAQGSIKLQPFFKHQVFKNYGAISEVNPIVNASSPEGISYDFGMNVLYKNTGLKLETGYLNFQSGQSIERKRNSLNDFAVPVNGVRRASQENYNFKFDTYAMSLVQQFNLRRFHLGVSAGFGILNAKRDVNGTVQVFREMASNSQEGYSYDLTYIYGKGKQFLGSVELGYNIFDRFVLFTNLNYSQGSFEHGLREVEVLGENRGEEYNALDISFRTLGISLGLSYSLAL